MSPMCDRGFVIESKKHFPLLYPFVTAEKNDLLNRLHNIKSRILNLEQKMLTDVLLFGSDKYEKVISGNVLKSTITYVK